MRLPLHEIAGRAVRVGIGEVQLGTVADSHRATLGSCVGLCLADPKRLRYALAHILLPECPEASKDDRRVWARYADTAVGRALDLLELDRRGKRTVRAYVAGGSQMYASEGQRKTVGSQNQMILERTLAENRITVVGSDFGGELGRQIVVDGPRGIVFTRRLPNAVPARGTAGAPERAPAAPGESEVDVGGQQWSLPASFRPLSGWSEGTGTGAGS